MTVAIQQAMATMLVQRYEQCEGKFNSAQEWAAAGRFVPVVSTPMVA